MSRQLTFCILIILAKSDWQHFGDYGKETKQKEDNQMHPCGKKQSLQFKTNLHDSNSHWTLWD